VLTRRWIFSFALRERGNFTEIREEWQLRYSHSTVSQRSSILATFTHTIWFANARESRTRRRCHRRPIEKAFWQHFEHIGPPTMAEEINSATRAIDLREVHHTHCAAVTRVTRSATRADRKLLPRRDTPRDLFLFGVDPSSPRPYPVTRDCRHAAGSAAILLRTRSTDAGCWAAWTRRTGTARTRARTQMRRRRHGARTYRWRSRGASGRGRQVTPGTSLRLQKPVRNL